LQLIALIYANAEEIKRRKVLQTHFHGKACWGTSTALEAFCFRNGNAVLSSCYVLSSSIYRTGPWIDASIEGIIVEFKPRPEQKPH
jgi:hypothetical protein